ncbi:MAG: hypothetical protein ABI345_13105 [Jatrophihabitans sp.]
MIGTAPGTTSSAFRGATCILKGPDNGIAGMIDQVACSNLDGGSKVVFYVGRFTGKSAVDSYLATLVARKYNKQYWTIEKQRRGLLLTSPSTVKFADVTSSICALPQFLVQFYADTGVTETAIESDYWKKATFPDSPPAICS